MCAIHFACNLINFKPMGANITLTDSLASIEGLRSTKISYQTNDMLFRTRRSLNYLEGLGYTITLMWMPSHVGIQGNERTDVLTNERSISGTLFQDPLSTRLTFTLARTRLLMAGKMERQRDGPLLLLIVPRVSIEAWMAATVDEKVFLVATSRLASNHTAWHSVQFAKNTYCSGRPLLVCHGV
jgi:hypothetical protein